MKHEKPKKVATELNYKILPQRDIYTHIHTYNSKILLNVYIQEEME